MLSEYLPWMIGLLLVGGAIVWLNDKMKHKKSPRTSKPKSTTSILGLILGVIATGGIIITAAYQPSTDWFSIALIGIVVLVVLYLVFVFRKMILAYLKSILSGRSFPRIIRQNKDGTMEMNCPRCSHKVTIHPGHKNESAFHCEHCDQTVSWESELKP